MAVPPMIVLHPQFLSEVSGTKLEDLLENPEQLEDALQAAAETPEFMSHLQDSIEQYLQHTRLFAKAGKLLNTHKFSHRVACAVTTDRLVFHPPEGLYSYGDGEIVIHPNIKKALKVAQLRWHPDKPNGDRNNFEILRHFKEVISKLDTQLYFVDVDRLVHSAVESGRTFFHVSKSFLDRELNVRLPEIERLRTEVQQKHKIQADLTAQQVALQQQSHKSSDFIQALESSIAQLRQHNQHLQQESQQRQQTEKVLQKDKERLEAALVVQQQTTKKHRTCTRVTVVTHHTATRKQRHDTKTDSIRAPQRCYPTTTNP
jgi:hypothetical protein